MSWCVAGPGVEARKQEGLLYMLYPAEQNWIGYYITHISGLSFGVEKKKNPSFISYTMTPDSRGLCGAQECGE